MTDKSRTSDAQPDGGKSCKHSVRLDVKCPWCSGERETGEVPSQVPRETMLHELKTWPAAFEAIKAGTKHHEIRKNDRRFIQGDLLQLREWDPSTEKYTDRERTVRVSYVSYGGAWGLPEDICVMSIERRSEASIPGADEHAFDREEYEASPMNRCPAHQEFELTGVHRCSRLSCHAGPCDFGTYESRRESAQRTHQNVGPPVSPTDTIGLSTGA